MNVMQRAAAIGRLQEMAERLPDGSFDKTAVNAAVGDMMLQIPGAAKFGGGAWRCGKRLEWPQAGEMSIEEGESYKERLMKKFTEVR